MIVSILAAIIALGATTAVMQSEPPKPPQTALEACIASAKQTKYEESEDVTGAIEECYENHD